MLVGRRNDPVVHPLPFSPSCYNPSPPQIGEMTRNLRLRHLQYLDEVADTYLILSHQIEQPQPVAIGKRNEELFEVESPVHSAHNRDHHIIKTHLS